MVPNALHYFNNTLCGNEHARSQQVMYIFRALSQPQVLLYSATVLVGVEKIVSSLANHCCLKDK